MTTPRTLYLIDGTYLLFRAFHSLPLSMALTGAAYMRNRGRLIELLHEGAGADAEPAGISESALAWLSDAAHDRLPTNAVRGLVSVLLKLIREERPSKVGIAFDLPGRVHRDDAYETFVARNPGYASALAGYKATRQETPVEIHVQYPLARLVCARGLGIPVLEAEGFEADDIIGTLSRRARNRGFAVKLVTADKDLFQLVEDGIEILNPHKSDPARKTSYLRMNPAVVEREFGVPPSQVVDVLALMGDTSDNIPGVPGIGEKGARELIRQFGSVEGCLEAAKEEGKIARPTYRRGLLEHAALALLSKELATIREDAPIDIDLGEVSASRPDPARIKEVFRLLAFEALMREAEGLGAPSPGEEAAPPSPSREVIVSAEVTVIEVAVPVTRAEEATAAGAEEEAAPEPAGAVVAEAEETDASRYRAVLDLEEVRRLLPAILQAPRVAVDTETTSENPMRAELVGVSIAWEPHRAIYIPLAHRYLGVPPQPAREQALAVLAPLLESSDKVKTGQNVKYDMEILRRAGAKPAGFDFDTMIAAFLIEPDRPSFALGVLAKEYLDDYKIPFSEVTGKGAKQLTFDQVEIGRAAIYSGRDADVTLRIAEVLAPRLRTENLQKVFDTIDMPLVEVLMEMELAGVRIDVELLARLSREMGEQIARLRSDIHALAGHEFNVDSPRQLGQVLFEELHLPAISKTAKSGVHSTRDEDLEVLAGKHPLPAKVRDYRALTKLRSTYVDALPAMVDPATGRVHTSFHPTGAATGRLSSSDPNLQNIPVRTEEGRKIRAAFVPEPGWTLVSADYSQVELRVMAEIAGDHDLRATFEQGEDIHRLTASRIYNVPYAQVTGEQRRAAKTINFGILYGMGPQRLARDLSISQSEAKSLIDSYFGRFPRVRAYIDETVARAERDGYVSTLFGRIRRFPNLVSTSRFQRQLAIRAAVNSTIQGTAADLMKIAMVRLHRALAAKGMKTRILIQVHDELVLESPSDELPDLEATIHETMEKIPPFTVPLVVDIGSGANWLDAKS